MGDTALVEWSDLSVLSGVLSVATGRIRWFRLTRPASGRRPVGVFTSRAKAPIALYRHWLEGVHEPHHA